MNATGGQQPARRDVLRWMAAGLAGSAGAAVLAACSGNSSGATEPDREVQATPTTEVASKVPPDRRVLVVVELIGGNDGLSTLVPHGSGRYRDLRPTLAVPDSQLVDIGQELAVHTELAPSWKRGMAAVLGVGSAAPSLSHFDMRARWSAGTPNRNVNMGTGFLGRLCDRLGTDGELIGMSISGYGAPALSSATPSTVALPDGALLRRLRASTDTSSDLLRRAIIQLSAGRDGPELAALGRLGLAQMDQVDHLVAGLPAPSNSYQPSGTAADGFLAQLEFASQLLRGETQVRVVHVPVADADFDTHDHHADRHPELLRTLNAGLEAFRADLEAAGLADEVLIATTTEFGRRVQQNGDGLDHGTSSCMFLMGPVATGLHGDEPSLRHLDDDGNLVATVSFDRFLATLSAWMDVDPHDVLPDRPAPLTGVLAS